MPTFKFFFMLKPSSSPSSAPEIPHKRAGRIAALLAATAGFVGVHLGWDEPKQDTPRSAVVSSSDHHKEKTRKPLTLAEFKENVPDITHWETMEAVLKRGVTCVDGRNRSEAGIEGEPGGDAGILLAVIQSIENKIGRPVSDAEVSQIVDAIPDTVYMHTSDHALYGHEGKHDGLLEAIERDPVLHAFVNKADGGAMKLLQEGTGDSVANEILARIVSRGDVQGCGHLAKSAQDPKAYRLSQGRTEQVIRSMYLRKWKDHEGQSTKVDPLPEDHNERAVVEVRVPPGTRLSSEIPVLQANSKKLGQVFVLGSKELAERRIEQFIDEVVKVFPDIDRDELQSAAEALFAKQSGETAHRLAKGLPHIIFNAKKDHEVSIEDGGIME